MNSLSDTTGGHSNNALTIRKQQILNQEQTTRKNIVNYCRGIRDIATECEKNMISVLDLQVLKYHEKYSELAQFMTKGNLLDDSSERQVIEDFIQLSIVDTPAIPIEKMQKIIRKGFQVSITNRQRQSCSDVLENLLLQEQGDGGLCEMSEMVIEKLQSERDYFQRRESELLSKIKEMQNGLSKRGLNIKEMSKSYLEDKCSRWALQRLTQEKKVLVERLGETSQEVLKLNCDIGDLQHQIKRLNTQSIGRSMVGATTLKSSSLVIDHYPTNQKVLDFEERRERQVELQLKNEQLLIEITKCMARLQDFTQANSIMSTRIEGDQIKIGQMTDLISKLEQANQRLSHDYEISLKRKATFEQQSKQLKNQLSKLREEMSEEKETYGNIIVELQQKQLDVIQKVKEIQDAKRVEMQKMQARLKENKLQRQKLLRVIEEQTSKKGEQINYKSLLNDQITKLMRQNAGLTQQLELKEQRLFDQDLATKKMLGELKVLDRKVEENKKQNSKLKKHNKELQKQSSQLQKQLENIDQVQFKIAQCQHNYSTILSEFNRFKEASDRKTGVNQKMVLHLKDKFTFQLTALLGEEGKGKGKKGVQKYQVIEKYIQEMLTLSNKTAQIKQLKDQIKDLKDGKEAKSISKRTKINSNEESVNLIEAGVLSLGTKIMQERLKAEKQLFDASFKEFSEALQKQQFLRKALQEDLDKEKILTTELKSRQKQETTNEVNAKVLRQKDEKIDKLEHELKLIRGNFKKVQTENSELESELKVKKDLSSGLKKECKDKDDKMKEVFAELSLTQDELQKIRRNVKEIGKKETMFKEMKERKEQLEQDSGRQKRVIEGMQERIKLLTKEIGKKNDCLKDLKNIEDREVRVKEDSKLKEANQSLKEHKDRINKLRYEVDRKDEIIKNLKDKTQNKIKEFEEVALAKQRECQKAKRESQLLQRKCSNIRNTSKKQENKNYLLNILVKKLFQVCVNSCREEPSRGIRESTQYYSASTISPQPIKKMQEKTPVSNLMKSSDVCEGLKILDLKPEDLQGYLGQTTINSRMQHQHQDTSWSIVSPIVCKHTETNRQQQLVSGLEQLQRLLGQKQLDSTSISDLFKRALRSE